jgi:hypothetical protein
VEETVLVLAEAVQDLPLRFCASPFDLCKDTVEQKKENGEVRTDAVGATVNN